MFKIKPVFLLTNHEKNKNQIQLMRVKILSCFANPRDKAIPQLSLTEEAQHLLDIEERESLDCNTVKLLMQTTPERLKHNLKKYKPIVLSVSGHTLPDFIKSKMNYPLLKHSLDKGAIWSEETSTPILVPKSSSQSSLAQYLSSCIESPGSSCELDKYYTCNRFNDCFLASGTFPPEMIPKLYIQDDVRFYSSPITFATEKYSRGVCLESDDGGLITIPPDEFCDILKTSYEDESPSVIFLNMCESQQIGFVLSEIFPGCAVVCWSTLAEDRSALNFYKNFLTGLTPFLTTKENAAALSLEFIDTAFTETYDTYVKHSRAGNPKTFVDGQPKGHGIPILFKKNMRQNIDPKSPQPTRRNSVEKTVNSAPGILRERNTRLHEETKTARNLNFKYVVESVCESSVSSGFQKSLRQWHALKNIESLAAKKI